MNHPLEQLDVACYLVPTDGPEADGTLSWDRTPVVVVEARADGTTYGTGWTYAPPAAGAYLARELTPHLLGLDVFDTPAAHAAMCAATRDHGRPGLASSAISAVDIALWDLKSRLLALPLTRLLGATRRTVPVYGSGGFTTYHDTHLASQLGGWVHGQGIDRVKIRIGEAWGRAVVRDLDRVRLAREVIGSQAELYVDASGAYTRKQAVRVGGPLAEHGVGWFEAPVPADDLTGLRLVRDSVVCDVTAGPVGDLAHFAHMIRAEAVDCLTLDATRCGGLTVFLRAAALAQAHGLEVSTRGAPHAHAHAAAAVPNLRHVEWFHDHVRVESMLFSGALDPTGGTLEPGPAPGHGMALRHEEAEAYRVL
ncbi:mandelate racemase [Streptomyces spiroverticillatus]|uniref:Mandelate racemase n=1 Tax=Streptomyces finlayi TaxID=67296 RepID=A0A918WZ67_9ACTN|nr:enolase C-terminal domain-like protein [Streptomyces finlayi]GHA13344.1 mandelate racemase [Streptomyces spiroverticillatus]GHC97994.1 mandelate racemase [Streptomyces finlayi]